jgi:hypothetical protein
MTKLTIEITGEDDRGAFKHLRALYELIGSTRPSEAGDYNLAPGYTTSDIYGSSTCEVSKSENTQLSDAQRSE